MLTQAKAKRLLSYDEATGILIWIGKAHPRTNNSIIGMRAGAVRKDGARQVRVDGRFYFEHSIIWLLVYGYIPKSIDHINMKPGDNRLANLRECTYSQNSANRKAQANNKLKVKGVSLTYNKKYFMQIRRGNVVIRKRFEKLSDAKLAYAEEAKRLYGEFARTE